MTCASWFLWFYDDGFIEDLYGGSNRNRGAIFFGIGGGLTGDRGRVAVGSNPMPSSASSVAVRRRCSPILGRGGVGGSLALLVDPLTGAEPDSADKAPALISAPVETET